jgi:predicted DNA-binding protein YlxM (UPF0122 family)
MNLQKSLEISFLNEFYGKLLTQKQQNILVEYYYNNMSLAEIAENNKVSRQAVLDSLRKSEKQLKHFESILQLVKKDNQLKQKVKQIVDKNDKQNLTSSKLQAELEALIKIWEGS